jgi:hypothetical protein
MKAFPLKRALVAAVLALFMLASVATAAVAPAGTYTGKTKQKRKISLDVDANAKVTKLDVNWRAKCKKPKKFWTGGTSFTNVPGNTDAFAKKGNYTSHTSSGFDGIIHVQLAGKFVTSSKAQGTFKAHVKVSKNGKKVDRCNVSTKWTAKA